MESAPRFRNQCETFGLLDNLINWRILGGKSRTGTETLFGALPLIAVLGTSNLGLIGASNGKRKASGHISAAERH